MVLFRYYEEHSDVIIQRSTCFCWIATVLTQLTMTEGEIATGREHLAMTEEERDVLRANIMKMLFYRLL